MLVSRSFVLTMPLFCRRSAIVTVTLLMRRNSDKGISTGLVRTWPHRFAARKRRGGACYKAATLNLNSLLRLSPHTTPTASLVP